AVLAPAPTLARLDGDTPSSAEPAVGEAIEAKLPACRPVPVCLRSLAAPVVVQLAGGCALHVDLPDDWRLGSPRQPTRDLRPGRVERHLAFAGQCGRFGRRERNRP